MERKFSKTTPSQGGGQCPVNQAFSEYYTRRFIFEFWQVKDICQLTASKRTIAVYTLHQYFGFSEKQLSDIFHRTRKTITRDLQAAEVYCGKNIYAKQQCKKLKTFIEKSYSHFLTKSVT